MFPTVQDPGFGRSNTLNNYDFLRPEERDAVAGPPIQGDEQLFLPLQAADLVAWQTRRFVFDSREAATGLESPESYVVNSPVMRKLETIKTIYNTYGVDRMKSMAEDCRMMKSLFPDKAAYLAAASDVGSLLMAAERPFRPWLR